MKLIYIVCLVVFFSSCNYDAKQIVPVTPNIPITPVDTTKQTDTTKTVDNTPKCDTLNVTYLKTIKPLIVKYCYNCHTDTSTHPNRNSYAFFNDFKQLKQYATARSVTNSKYTTIQARIRQIESPAMPLGLPPMSECDIRKIEIWISQGALEN